MSLRCPSRTVDVDVDVHDHVDVHVHVYAPRLGLFPYGA